MRHHLRLAGLLALVVVLGGAAYAVAAKSQQQRPFKGESFEVVTSEGIFEESDCPAFECWYRLYSYLLTEAGGVPDFEVFVGAKPPQTPRNRPFPPWV